MESGKGGVQPPATVIPFSRRDSKEAASPIFGLKHELVFDPSQFWAILDMLPIAVLVGRGRDCAEIEGNSAARVLLRTPPGQNLSRSAPEDERPEFEIYAGGRLVAPSELPMQRAAATGKPVHRSECELRFTNGSTVFLAGHSVPLVNQQGEVCGSIGAFIDITHSKQLERQNQMLARELQRLNAELEQRVHNEAGERKTLQARLAQVQRMDALGQLASGIAHDINNVLQAVQGAASLILRHPHDPARVTRFAGIIASSAEQGSAVTGRLLSFARAGEASAEPVDLARVLAGLQEILAHTLGAGVRLRVEAQAALPALLVDPRQLETVLINLAVNSRDAMEGSGLLTLDARLVHAAESEATLPDLPPGSYVCLSIADTGSGISPEVLTRVTEPFFTTKPQGTGLGLAMAYEFAREAGGMLHIASVPGEGTTVRLWLPAMA